MGKTIEEINREIALENAQVSRELATERKKQKLSKAKRTLFSLRHRKAIRVVRAIGKGGKKVSKAYKKQKKRNSKRSSSGSSLPDYSVNNLSKTFGGY